MRTIAVLATLLVLAATGCGNEKPINSFKDEMPMMALPSRSLAPTDWKEKQLAKGWSSLSSATPWARSTDASPLQFQIDKVWCLPTGGHLNDFEVSEDRAHWRLAFYRNKILRWAMDGKLLPPDTFPSWPNSPSTAASSDSPATPPEAIAVASSPDGSEVAWVIAADGGQRVVRNGVMGPVWAKIHTVILLWPEAKFQNRSESGFFFSDDGKHLVYVAEKDGKVFAVVDGRRGAAFEHITDLAFTPKGVISYVGTRDSEDRLVVGEVTSPPVEAIVRNKRNSVLVDATGRVAALAIDGDKRFVIVDDTLGPSFDRVNLRDILYSADGKHFAYEAETGNDRYLVLDHEVGPRHDWVEAPVFSADGRHLAYTAGDDGRMSAIVDKKSIDPDGLTGSPQFSPDSQHLLWIEFNQGSQRIMVDGAPGPWMERIFDSAFDEDSRFVETFALSENCLQRIRVEVRAADRSHPLPH